MKYLKSKMKIHLFKVISDRSERGSIIVTTNLEFSRWTELFENTSMVATLIDRLTFKSHVLDMNGDSYRLKSTLKKWFCEQVAHLFVRISGLNIQYHTLQAMAENYRNCYSERWRQFGVQVSEWDGSGGLKGKWRTAGFSINRPQYLRPHPLPSWTLTSWKFI